MVAGIDKRNNNEPIFSVPKDFVLLSTEVPKKT